MEGKNFWQFLHPFKFIQKDRTLFFVWAVIVLIIGQIGILITFFSNWGTLGFVKSLILNVQLGNIYTFGIACLAAGLFDFAKDYAFNAEAKFRSFKLVCLFLAMAMIIGLATLCSGTSFPMDKPLNEYLDELNWKNLIVPSIIYIGVMGVSTYIFCVTNMETYYSDFKHLDNDSIRQLQNRVGNTENQDERGFKM